ncbi:MAG: ATP-binding protein [Solirubrobacteraceae bacterium]
MKAPISFVYGNCVFGERPDDVWAAFTLPASSYAWLSTEAKHARMLRLACAIEAIDADFQILRVAGEWDRGRYAREHLASSAPRHRALAQRYAAEQSPLLGDVGHARVGVFLLVSLRTPQRDIASELSCLVRDGPRKWLRSAGRLSQSGIRTLDRKRIERLRNRVERVHARLNDFVVARPSNELELQWLVRRAFCRALGEPAIERLHAPVGATSSRDGQPGLLPSPGRVARWLEGSVEHGSRCLRIRSKLGESWQACLVLGALPERVTFPGSGAELMFAVPENLAFPVDLSLNARLVPNELALRMVRRRVQDADQVARAEADGDQGVSDGAHERTERARDLLAYLQAGSRPPLLRATLAVAIGANSQRQLTERVEACQRAYGEVRVHRPPGDQLQLFVQHLPGQRTRVRGYDDMLTVEQAAAMMATATHAAGSRKGFYLGHTLSGSRQPVRFNLREGSDGDCNSAILSVGALGSGKTTLTQKLQYEAFLQGARVIDCDPKGDHRFHLLDQVAPHAQAIALRADAKLRGVLDPLRIAPAHLRRDAAVSFLCDLLPAPHEPLWETAVLAAVERVIERCPHPTCGEVVRALLAGEEGGRQVASALEVYARSGITQLGFADPRMTFRAIGEHQVTYLSIRDLPCPEPGTRRSEYSHGERVGQQLVRLISMLAMCLLSHERERSGLTVFAFDEGWRLLGDPVGRALLASLQRMGRSELAVPIVSTQLVTDALIGSRESLENLLGATFVFGMRSRAEASRALALLGLDPTDRRARELLLALDAGRCLMRDHRGRVEAVAVELPGSLLRAFSTTPRARGEGSAPGVE